MKQKVILLILICSFISCKSKKEANQKNKPNLIFVLVDDLGKEWVSCYGAQGIQTPHIDAMANNGIRFDNAYSMPQCTPSRVALLTGQYPYKNGWVDHYDVPRWGHQARFDPKKNSVFAKELKNAGYTTCVAGKWQINDFRLEPEAMVNAGFDAYCMWTGGEGGGAEDISDKRYWDPYIHTKEGSKTYEGQFGPDIFSDFIIDFMKNNKEKPMCIYYPMVLAHTPLVHTPHEPDVKTKIEKHRAMVRYTDFIVGKLEKAIEDLGIADNTYLFFTTDNGTSTSIIGKRNDHYIRGGKTKLSENGIDAPFIVKVPRNNKGIESDALIDFTDIFPTFLELANVESDVLDDLNGKSFAKILTQEASQSDRDWILSMGCHPACLDKDNRVKNYHKFRDRVFRDNQFKIYVDTNRIIHRIYDLENDPYELNNLIKNNEKVGGIVNKFNTILKTIPLQDNNPEYTKTGRSYYDISREVLNKKSKGTHRRKNMCPLETKEAYLEQEGQE